MSKTDDEQQDPATPGGWPWLIVFAPFLIAGYVIEAISSLLRRLAKPRRSAPSGNQDEG